MVAAKQAHGFHCNHYCNMSLNKTLIAEYLCLFLRLVCEKFSDSNRSAMRKSLPTPGLVETFLPYKHVIAEFGNTVGAAVT